MGRLDNRVIIVTGGALGIGRAFASGFVREGAKVVIADINGPAGEQAAAELGEEGGDAIAVTTDVSDEESAKAMAAAAIEHFGRIDGLVNNAAIALRVPKIEGPIEEITVEDWDRVMAVNLRGTFLCSRAVIGHMKGQGYGKIINMSSSTFFSGRTNAHYVASKGGVIAFTRVLAREVGDWNITVNSIAPGLTASLTDGTDESLERYKVRVPARAIKRIEEPEDLVGAAIFLMSSESDFMSGQTMAVDGGAVMH